MTVPKQRHTKSRRNKRRMHLFIKPRTLAKCSKCSKPVLGHTVCKNCGYYGGREVIDVLKKLTKKEQKQRQKEMAAKEAHDHKESGMEKAQGWEGLSKK